MLLGETDSFKLEREGRDIFLSYEGEILIQGCDRLIDLTLRLSISTPPIIEALKISEEEENALEQLLNTQILKKKHNNICYDSTTAFLGEDFGGDDLDLDLDF